MIARYEAEFSGRTLHGPDDAARWLAEPEHDSLCWGILGIEGLDFLIREQGDLDRLPALFDRGVRVFQLANGSLPGGDRGLTDLELSLLDALANLAPPPDKPGPRPVIDLAGLNHRSTANALSWFEADTGRSDRLPLLCSCGGIEFSGLTHDILARLRALGGLVGLGVGLPYVSSRRASPREHRSGRCGPLPGSAGLRGHLHRNEVPRTGADPAPPRQCSRGHRLAIGNLSARDCRESRRRELRECSSSAQPDRTPTSRIHRQRLERNRRRRHN